jgi:hypothetical protein
MVKVGEFQLRALLTVVSLKSESIKRIKRPLIRANIRGVIFVVNLVFLVASKKKIFGKKLNLTEIDETGCQRRQ